MSCCGLYLNASFSPQPTEFLLALSKNRIPVGTRRGPTEGPTTNEQYEYAPAYSEGPVIPTEYRVMSCSGDWEGCRGGGLQSR